MARTGSARTEDLDVHSRATRLDLCPHTHFGTGDRVRVVFTADMTSAQGLLCTSSSVRAITSFSRDHSYYLDEFEGLSLLLIIFAGGQNDNNK